MMERGSRARQKEQMTAVPDGPAESVAEVAGPLGMKRGLLCQMAKSRMYEDLGVAPRRAQEDPGRYHPAGEGRVTRTIPSSMRTG